MEQEFVTLPREVAKRALAYIEQHAVIGGLAVRDALRAALEQPQSDQPAMTPIAQRKLEDLVASGHTISGYSIYHKQKHQHGFVTGAGLVGWWKPEGMEYPQPLGEQEPDWSDSKTLPSELWKNPLLSLQERLQIADGAVQWNREVAENLRARLCAAQQPQGEQEPVAFIRNRIGEDFSIRLNRVVTAEDFAGDTENFLAWCRGNADHDWRPLYTRPQPKRPPLTDEEIDKLDWGPKPDEPMTFKEGLRDFARAIEAAHNIK